MGAHSLLSASSAPRYVACPGSVALTAHLPRTSNAAADEGTAAHALAAECLISRTSARAAIGSTLSVDAAGIVGWHLPGQTPPPGVRVFPVDADMATAVQVYVDAIRAQAERGTLEVEQKIDLAPVLNQPGEGGTADAVVMIAADAELQIHDLKYGRGVKVEAPGNYQLIAYAAGAIDDYASFADVERVRLFIHQPRLAHVSEALYTVDQLTVFVGDLRRAARMAVAAIADPSLVPDLLHPGEAQCKFCGAAGTCPALAAYVQKAVGADFAEVVIRPPTLAVETASDADLSLAMGAVDLIETWCKATRGEVEARLFAGRAVDGYKLVQGRRGHRAWRDQVEAVALLKAARLKFDQMYESTLISPTTAEKLAAAAVIGPRVWTKLQTAIVQSEGRPSVAPVSDPRPALVIQPAADDFAALA